MDNYDLLLGRIDERLTEAKFKLWRKISMVDNLDTDIFASRIRWLVGRNSEHVFIQYKVRPVAAAFEELFDQGLAYAKRAYPIPLPLQLWTNYKIIGCIATTNVTSDLIAAVTSRPGAYLHKRIIHGYYQLPVLIDIDSGKTHYYRGIFCHSLRQLVKEYVEPQV